MLFAVASCKKRRSARSKKAHTEATAKKVSPPVKTEKTESVVGGPDDNSMFVLVAYGTVGGTVDQNLCTSFYQREDVLWGET
jgi:hypothetical protein